jgi:hypothetical protein
MKVQVPLPARHLGEVFPTELIGDEEMEKNLGDWRRMNGL